MYRIPEIQSALAGLVGWRKDPNPAYRIDEDLTQSDSGLYFQDVHPLLTLENLYHCMPDRTAVTYAVYDAGFQYRAGDVVANPQDNKDLYEALQDSTGAALSDGEYWSKYDPFSAFLRSIRQSGVALAVQTFINGHAVDNRAKSLLDKRAFFDGTGRIADAIQSTGKVVGYEVVPIRALGVTTKIERIGLQMTGSGPVTVYVFHSSLLKPVYTFQFDVKAKAGYQWFPVKDCYLPYLQQGNAGGSWYVCYNQPDLPAEMQAVNLNRDWSQQPCACRRGEYELWKMIHKYLEIYPFAVRAEADFARNPELWDIACMGYTYTRNYGMNLEVTIECDYTDFIVEQRMNFAEVVAKQVAVNALRTMAYNPNVRINRNQSNITRTDILFELEGNTAGRPSGLVADLARAYKSLQLDTAGMSRICLPCHNGGVRYGSVAGM